MQFIHCYNFAFMYIFVFLTTLEIICANAANVDYNNDDLCTSQACKETGDEITKNIDHSISPCDDFYEHACGRWTYPDVELVSASQPGPPRRQYIDQFEIVNMKLRTQLRNVFQEITKDNQGLNSETHRKFIAYYDSCTDLAGIDARGLNRLESIVLANGGWPFSLLLNDSSLKDQNLTLQKIHDNYAKITFRPALFNIDVRRDLSKSGRFFLQLRSPKFVTHVNKRKIIYHNRAYGEYSGEVATEFARLRGFNVSYDNITDDVVKIWRFEDSLKALYLKNSGRDYKTNHRKTTVDELQKSWDLAISEYPDYAIDWLETIRSAFEGTDIVIDATEKIILRRNLIEELTDLLKKNSLRTVVSYVHWNAIGHLVPYTNKAMRDRYNRWFENSYGFGYNDYQRSIYCMDYHQMHKVLIYTYVRKYFVDTGSELRAFNMISSIQAGMKQKIESSSWMDDKLKFLLTEKINKMVNNFGYPLWYNEPGTVDDYYSELEVGSDYFENVINYNRFERIKFLKKLRIIKPINRTNPEKPYFTDVNMYYSRTRNTITLPGAMFQMPFFDNQRPSIFNFGSVGFMIGHEIAHAFDPQGVWHNNAGGKKLLLSRSMVAEYIQRTNCYIDQYNGYAVIDSHTNETRGPSGEQTLLENFADNTGFAIALEGYHLYTNEHNRPSYKIPILQNYTDDELFFYSFANVFCKLSNSHDVLNSNIALHSSASTRINEVVSNSRKFSEVFNCPKGSLMNSWKKCDIWN